MHNRLRQITPAEDDGSRAPFPAEISKATAAEAAGESQERDGGKTQLSNLFVHHGKQWSYSPHAAAAESLRAKAETC